MACLPRQAVLELEMILEMEERSVRVGMIFSSILRIKIIFLFIRFKLFMSPPFNCDLFPFSYS